MFKMVVIKVSATTDQGWRSSFGTAHALLLGCDDMQWKQTWEGGKCSFYVLKSETQKTGGLCKAVLLLFLHVNFQVKNHRQHHMLPTKQDAADIL